MTSTHIHCRKLSHDRDKQTPFKRHGSKQGKVVAGRALFWKSFAVLDTRKHVSLVQADPPNFTAVLCFFVATDVR